MKITEDIRNVHQSLSQAGLEFLDFVQKEPAALEAASFPVLTTYDDGVVTLQPWPTFVSRRAMNQLGETALGLCNLIKSLPKRLFSNDPKKLKDYFVLTEDEAKYLPLCFSDDHLFNLFGRGDFILSPSGLKCVEYNITSNVGGWQLPIWQKIYLQNPVIGRFMDEYKIKPVYDRDLVKLLSVFLIDNGLKKFSRNVEELNVAVIIDGRKNPAATTPHEVYFAEGYKDILKTRYNGLKGDVIICDYPQLNVKNGRLFLKNKRIHSIIEYYGGYVPLGMLFSFSRGELLIYNGPITPVTVSKLNIALLSENEDSHLFNTREKEIIKKHVPWTRKIRDIETLYNGKKVNLLNFIRTNRENLVIKPAGGYGGIDVHVGRYISQVSWEQNLENAINKGDHLVQEYVESLPLLYQCGENGCCPHISVWGLFTFGDQFCGGFTRILPIESDAGVINCKQGADGSLLFEVEE